MLASTVRQRLRPRTRVRELAERRRELAERRRVVRVSAQYARWREEPVSTDTVLYEAFFGKGMLDSPEAIFRYLLDQPDQLHLRHVWVLDDLEGHQETRTEFAGHPRVSFVELESPEYLRALATSTYLVNNSTFPQTFAKRPGQVYLNTWHGIPLKRMGFDMPEGGIVSRNIVRNFLSADYLLSANPFMTETFYRRAYRLQGIFRGAVIEEGQPRLDRQRQSEEEPDVARRLLEQRGTDLNGRRIVLYAPTWRGDRFQEPHVNAAQLLSTVRQLQSALDPEKYVVLLKVHQAIYEAIRARVPDATFIVADSIPTNQVLGVTDVLVTDYSSLFFDFLATGRPVVYYLPDLDEYRDSRGLYLDPEELPGPVCDTISDAVDHLRQALDGSPASVRSKEAAEVYCPHDDGSVTKRVVDLVFRGADESAYTVHRDFGTEKETLLVYLGGMKSMGITTSALNLLRNLDYERYDVTAFWVHSRGRDRVKNAILIDPRVRVIPRAAYFNGSPPEVRAQVQQLMVGLSAPLSQGHRRFWTDEWQRTFGDARFDHLIDFSGYGCFTPFLYSVAEASQKSIWLHNDMMADMQRETAGVRHLEDRLRAVFSTYQFFDNLVSVSPELNRVNREKLAGYAEPERFRYAVNTIDGDRVLAMAAITAEQAAAKAEGREVAANATEPAAGTLVDTENVASAVRTLLRHYRAGELIREARSRQRISNGLSLDGSQVTFVTVGRLSPEKNQARMIRAFARVHERHPHVRLVILGGGQLQEDLEALVLSLGLEYFVVLAGQVDNPYAIMAEADCFVLSSDYEGQPMVILEARALGLPVVTTAFSSVGDSVPESAGIVVPQTVKGVAGGMERYLRGEVRARTLDFAEYNAQAMEQFYAAIGAGHATLAD